MPSPTTSGGERLALSGRRRPSVGLLAEHRVVADDDVLAEHGARVDDRRLRDLVTRLPLERALELLERAHDREPVRACGAGSASPRDEREEVLALEAQRLVVRDLRAPDVAGARHPLGVACRRALRPLVVDRDLPLGAPCRRRRPSSGRRRRSACASCAGRARRGACARRRRRGSGGSRRRRPRPRVEEGLAAAEASSGSSPTRWRITERSCAPRLQRTFSSRRIFPKFWRLP